LNQVQTLYWEVFENGITPQRKRAQKQIECGL